MRIAFFLIFLSVVKPFDITPEEVGKTTLASQFFVADFVIITFVILQVKLRELLKSLKATWPSSYFIKRYVCPTAFFTLTATIFVQPSRKIIIYRSLFLF